MNPLTQSKNATILPLLIALMLGCSVLSPQTQAVDVPPDGSYRSQNTAEDDDALFSLTTGAANTAMGFDVLDSNTTGSDNALASWSWRVTHSLNTARSGHTATLLQNGMVLVAGGVDSTGFASASAELYDPASRSWTATGSLNTARYLHTATLLPSGKVLVAAGEGATGYLSSAELYDFATGSWSEAGSLANARSFHTATLLQNGMIVLVAGGT